jgi:hypothetical protein
MVCQAGVGFSEHTESPAAAREATTRALAEAGGTGDPALVLVFHTANHDPVRFHHAVRELVGPRALLVGGYAGGVITRDHLGHDGWQSAVAVIFSTEIRFDAFLERGLDTRGEHAVGEALGGQVRAALEAIGPDHTGLLYMYDSIKTHSAAGFDLNIGTHLIAGMQRALGAWPLAAGMGMIGDIQFRPTRQFFRDQVVDQSAIAVVVHGGGMRLDVEVLHGTKPASDYHTVTRAEGNVVLELDGAPALDVIDAVIGGARRWEDYPMLVTLGVNKGDKYADYDEEAYASRLCMAIDRERKALIMFEPDLTAGTEVQLMRRDVDNFDYIHARAARLTTRLAGRTPVFALYIDCLGRASAYCGSEREEAAVIQEVLGARMPLLGLYTGVEIAPVGATPQQALDWTGVLWVLSEPGA